MEKRVDSLVFRRMSHADFRHINKVGGEEEGGGGQSYIDFPVRDIELQVWYDFLGPNSGIGAGDRPQWDFKINSFGINQVNDLRIYQRREASVSIASQKIHSRLANRVPAWHPTNGFPEDYDHVQQNLVLYIAKTIHREYWAGWFLEDQIPANWLGNSQLKRMFTEESAGYIKFINKMFVETTKNDWPFYFNAESIVSDIPTAEDIEDELVLEDTSPRLQELISSGQEIQLVTRFIQIRKRNNALVKNLKRLYGGQCQITGEEFTFLKTNGELYSEVHHLIALGNSGSDSYANTIVVSPMVHRMLHFAKVSEIDLSKIVDNKLKIQINDKDYEIKWHHHHLDVVKDVLDS
ncbi:HNH endonuclease [Flavobacterium sp. CAN_S2]|uniref:HNH endonuclease n=1 Tax=Flavobacterium sp. CAN_S2 TaxID=2787726 RepID=UPI0018C9224A